MANNIKSFDNILNTPKAKLNALVKNYLVANSSQVFAQEKSITFKRTLAINNNDPDIMADNITNDMKRILERDFDNVVINIEVITRESDYIIKMGLLCDGVTYDEAIPFTVRKALHNSVYLKIYNEG